MKTSPQNGLCSFVFLFNIKTRNMRRWHHFRLFLLKNNVIFHWLITINIYMAKIFTFFRVKCEE